LWKGRPTPGGVEKKVHRRIGVKQQLMVCCSASPKSLKKAKKREIEGEKRSSMGGEEKRHNIWCNVVAELDKIVEQKSFVKWGCFMSGREKIVLQIQEVKGVTFGIQYWAQKAIRMFGG